MEFSMFMRNDWKLLLLLLHDATESVIFTNVLWYFVIVAFMLCYLESLILRLLSSMLIVLFFSICTFCTLLNECDKSETEIGAYKPLGFLSHLQYKCYLCEYVSILIFG